MSQIDFSKAPNGATHYLGGGPDVLWYQVGNSIWLWGGAWQLVMGMPTALLPIPSAEAPDWSKAPEGSTHWVISARERVPTGWYRADGNKMRCVAQEGEYLFRLDDVQHADSGLTLIERPAAEPAPFSPDWATAPDNATHHYGASIANPWRMNSDGSWLAWVDGEWSSMVHDPKREYIPRPAVEFVPRDFSGQVIDHGSLPVLILELIDAYQGEADPAHYRVGLVDTLRAKVKELAGAPEWDGEGLPPTGIDCERSFSHSTWKATHICGHSTDGAYAAFYDGDGLMGWNDHCKFRPSRTQEQIEAEALEEERKAIRDVINHALEMGGDPAIALQALGYRKPVEVSQ